METDLYEVSIEKDSVFNIFSFLTARGAKEEDLSGKIELVSGYLDTTTAGSYRLRYRIEHRNTVKEIEILLYVRDDPIYPTSALPTVELQGDNPLSVALSVSTFTDPGAFVVDSNGRQMPESFLSKSVHYFDLDLNRFTETAAVFDSGPGVYRIDYNGFDHSGKAAKTVSRFVFYGNDSSRRVTITLNPYPDDQLLPSGDSSDEILNIEAGAGKSYQECGGVLRFIENGSVVRVQSWFKDVSEVEGLSRTKAPSFATPGLFDVYYWYSQDGTVASVEAFTRRSLSLADRQPPTLTLGNQAADDIFVAPKTWQDALTLPDSQRYELNAGQNFTEPVSADKRFPKIEDNCDRDLLWSRVQTSFFRYNTTLKEAESITVFPDPAARRGDIYFIRYSATDRSGNMQTYWRTILMKSGTPAAVKFYYGKKETRAVVYGHYSESPSRSFLPTAVAVDGGGTPLESGEYSLSVVGTVNGSPKSVDYEDGSDLEKRLYEAGLIDLKTPGQYALDFTLVYDGLTTVVKRYVTVFNYDGISVKSALSNDNLTQDKYALQWTHTQKEKGFSNAMVLYRSPKRSGREWTRIGLVGENEYISVPYGISFYKLIPARIGEDGECAAILDDCPDENIIQLCRPFAVVEEFQASDRTYLDRIELQWKATENADFYKLYSGRDSAAFPLTSERFLTDIQNAVQFTIKEHSSFSTAYTRYFQLQAACKKSTRGWKTDISDTLPDEIVSTETAKAKGMRELSDTEWLREVLIEIGALQSRFNLGDGSFGEGGTFFIDGGSSGAFYHRVWNSNWPENDWLQNNRSTLLDYFQFNNDGRRLKLSGGIAYLYLFTKSSNGKDYNVGITAKAVSSSRPAGLKRQAPLTVLGDYPGTVDIHGLLEDCWNIAASHKNDKTVTNVAGENLTFRGNRWVGNCDGRSGDTKHGCPGYRFSEQDWRSVLGFYENGKTTFSHRGAMFRYTRDGGAEKTHDAIRVP